jgi:hypothetical protein
MYAAFVFSRLLKTVTYFYTFKPKGCMGILKSLNRRWQLFRLRNLPPVKRVISFWERGGIDFDYYKKAEDDVWINPFWVNDSAFNKLFDN